MLNINRVKKFLDNPIIALCVSVGITALIVYVYKNFNKIITNHFLSDNEYGSNGVIVNDTTKIIVV